MYYYNLISKPLYLIISWKINNQLYNLNFALSFRRSHCILLLPNNHQLTSPCRKKLDINGDHMFYSHSQKGMHNTIRNILYTITSTLGHYTSFITNTNCCKRRRIITLIFFSTPTQKKSTLSPMKTLKVMKKATKHKRCSTLLPRANKGWRRFYNNP